ncbi:hypothetical protein K431DRAFT_277948 [Polychaeton citri CBS 116435]|uniref:Uncharacterized protein n=1 Tax=Polychaeton citri CBS 116435 TaxID=1314669 RepID=A0A9P4PZG7_9PEZI|nr:hypothetical protein K431DRAFT_277948 [Polychaeton citri CBS 116435]
MYSDIDRRDSLPAYHARNNSIGSVRTRSIAYGAGVSFERPAGYEVSDDDIIVVAVRVSRRRSQEARAARSFLRRMSTRLSSIGSGDGADFKTLKMPRREYKRYFVRDNSGNYAGTEPQREWNEDELEREFGMYQHMRLVPAVGF